MKVHLRALLTGSLLAALAPFASAHAAAGPPGSLTPFPTPQLCFSQAPASGCTSAPGLESARAVAISADGLNVYVGGGTTIAAFQRNAKTGQLTQAAGAIGCVSSSVGGCGHALGLSGVSQIALSPDGRHLYAVSSIANSVTGFARDVKTGALIQLKGAAGCVRPGGLGGCASGVGLLGATALAISPDGRSLYVAGRDADAVAAFAIDPTGGALLQLGGRQACIRGGDDAGECALRARACGRRRARHLARRRDAVRGRQGRRRRLRPAARRHDRRADAAARPDRLHPRSAGGLGCTTGRALAQPSALAIAAGGRDIYVASASGNAVSVLQRDPASGNADAARRRGRLHRPGRCRLRRRSAADGSRRARDRARRHEPHRGDRRRRRDPHAPSRHRHRRARAEHAARGLHLDDRRGRLPAARAARTRRRRSRSPRPATRSTPPPAAAWSAFARQAPPTCLTRELRAGVNVPTQILMPCTDPNGDALTYAIASKATHGSAGCDQGRVGDLPAEARLQGPRRVRHHGRRRLGRDHDGHRHRARHARRHRPGRAPRRAVRSRCAPARRAPRSAVTPAPRAAAPASRSSASAARAARSSPARR